MIPFFDFHRNRNIATGSIWSVFQPEPRVVTDQARRRVMAKKLICPQSVVTVAGSGGMLLPYFLRFPLE